MLLIFFFHSSSLFFFIIYPYSRLLLKRRKFLFYMPFIFIISSYYFCSILYYVNSFADSTEIYALQILKTYTNYWKHDVNPLKRISLFIFLVYYFYLFAFFPLLKKGKRKIRFQYISFYLFSFNKYAVWYF